MINLKCIKCGKDLSNNEIGLHKKLVHRAAKEFFCIDCLGDYYGISVEALRNKIEFFKRQGCTLFQEI